MGRNIKEAEFRRCKGEGCDRPIRWFNKSGLCETCSRKIRGAKYRAEKRWEKMNGY